MNIDNLSILITPCIFRCPVDNPLKELTDTKKLIEVTRMLLNNY